jgi:Protein of unknown function (DUF3306)
VSEDLGAKLNRWSQRKHAARHGVAPEDTAADIRRGDERQPSAADVAKARQQTAAVEAVSADDEETPVLPPIDELTAESDYTVFLGKNVPQALTNAALRKLWLSDPVFANLDRLNDYDDDYSIVESVVSAVRTSYQVGKGHIDEAEETVAKLEPADADEESEKIERAESPADSSAPDGEASGATIGNSDAPGDESDAAPRQMSAAEPDDVDGGQAEDKDN